MPLRPFADQPFHFLPIPTGIHFGFGVLDRLPEILKSRNRARVFVVTDPGVRHAGLLDTVLEHLRGLDHAVYDEVRADSGSELIEEATRRAKDFAADAVLGLGGGSSMDTAKAVALMTVAENPLRSYLGLGNVRDRPLPMIAVPTTAGTGSEVTLWSVFTDDESGIKVAIGSTLLYPETALCDPELTLDLPPALTASTGMDALAHAVECYTNNACQPISGALALEAITLIGRHLRGAVHDGQDRLARYRMLLASTMAGIAMNSTRLGLTHALAMPLGSRPNNIAHGVANAITLPHVMRFNCEAEAERYASVAAALGEPPGGSLTDAARAAAEAVHQLAVDVGIPAGLTAVGFQKDTIPSVVTEAMKSGNVAVNPRPARPDDLEQILLAAL